MTFKEYLSKVYVAGEVYEWIGDMSVEDFVASCPRGDWLQCLAKRIGVEKNRLSLAYGHCAATVINLEDSDEIKNAINALIDYGNGKITEDVLSDCISVISTNDDDDIFDQAPGASYSSSVVHNHAYDTYIASVDFKMRDTNIEVIHTAAYATAHAAVKTNELATADICRKHIGEYIIDIVNKNLKINHIQ
ncbi:MAG TPA: hypothetical protein VGF79_00980 [Bacteroidia bacterium]